MDHIQKIKPRVEQVCRELGLQYATEDNTGRMYINLQGGPAVIPPSNGHAGGGQHGGGYQQPQQPQQQPYPGQQQQGGYNQGGGGGDNNQNEGFEKILPKIIKKLEGCCVVM